MAARTAVVAGTATAVSGHVARNQQEKANQQYEAQQYEAQQAAAAAAPPPAPAAAAAPDMAAQLQQLAELKAQGLLTDQEFADAKAKLLAG
jgi:type IV secretory pathway VirB10-like protein